MRCKSVHQRHGFSFIEVLIVIVIIGILAGAVTMSTRHFIDRARYNRAMTDIRALCAGIEDFYASHGRYPTNEEGLDVLEGVHVRNDPWGRPYQYVYPGVEGEYDVISYGAAGEAEDASGATLISNHTIGASDE